MIGLVLVSHSAKLADGLLELLQQMVQDRVPIAVAAGTDNPEEPIGTDPFKVFQAIEEVYSDDGVLVLMDLGSALMSAETAIEFLAEDQQQHIYLCEAPLIEGGIAAAVQAAGGSPINDVVVEARGALPAKTAQLAPMLRIPNKEIIGHNDGTLKPENQGAVHLEIAVPNTLGLHARPAAKIVGAVSDFEADVRIRRANATANARSINQIATLGARQGDSLTFTAIGQEADEALAAIQRLASDNFGDVEQESLPNSATEAASATGGIGASEGIAVGPVVHVMLQTAHFTEQIVDDSNVEWRRLDASIRQAVTALRTLESETASTIGAEQATIFEAQRLMLEDPELQEAVQTELAASNLNAEAVWQRVVAQTAATYTALENEYLAARAMDLRDVGQRVLRLLTGTGGLTLDVQEPSVLVAQELDPSLAASLPTDLILGILLEGGGRTSHSAILARSLGIPTVVNSGVSPDILSTGQTIALDGTTGQVWLEPTIEEITHLESQRQTWLADRRRLLEDAHKPTVTRNGERIEITANIGSATDASTAASFGAEGVGLFRTEFLFLGRTTAPGEEEQYAAYNAAAQALAGKPLVIRTLDIGGDKPISYLPTTAEENPFLGLRGIRFCLANLTLFRTQLRALLRAASHQDIRIMLPMVSTLDELAAARTVLTDVQQALAAEDIEHNSAPQVGIMIETPAAAWSAAQFAQAVDFFSIGTNDLSQYIMAADRGNPLVSDLPDPLQPAVIAAIAHVAQIAQNAGVHVAMCGELAADPLAIPLLIGLGIEELSMSAPAIPLAKEAVRGVGVKQAQLLANDILRCTTVADVRRSLESHILCRQ